MLPGDEGYEGLYWLEAWAETEDALPNVVQSMTDIGAVMRHFTAIANQGEDDLEENDRQKKGTKGRLLAAIRLAERMDEPLDLMEEVAARYLADTTAIEPGIVMLMDRVERGEVDLNDPEERQGICAALKAMVDNLPIMQDFTQSARTTKGQMMRLRSLAKPVAVRMNRLGAAMDLIVKASERFIAWGERAESLYSSICEGQGPEDDEAGPVEGPSCL